jgi:hypothetical protein
MSVSDPVYIGIDLTSSREECIFVVVDRELNLIEMDETDVDDVIAFLASQKNALVAINAPSNVNQGVVKAKLSELNPDAGHQFRGVDLRLAEYELRQLGITVVGTPSREDLCAGWMQVGFGLYRALMGVGYQSFPTTGANLQFMETHPHACFCVLLEQTPFPHPTLEGRLQRQLILHELGLHINDPMEFFEEITRFKFRRGILPLDAIYASGQLDVLVAAYSAWVGGNQQEGFQMIGDLREGQIMLPVKNIQERY